MHQLFSFSNYSPNIYFFRTRLYLEYKLCRLLLRTLENRTARVSSRGLGGYSRATSYTVFSPVGNVVRPSSRVSNQSWPGILIRHYGRRPLGSATSLPAMMNLGMAPNGQTIQKKENGRESNKDVEEKMEGEKRITKRVIRMYRSDSIKRPGRLFTSGT